MKLEILYETLQVNGQSRVQAASDVMQANGES